MANKKTIFVLGVLFYGALNLFFTFHLKADDFSYQWLYWACAPSCAWYDVLQIDNVVRNPIFLLQYLMIKINPAGLNGFFFLFQMLHAFNAVLLFKLVEKHMAPKKIAFLAALFFLFYPNNFEILYWRSCLFYVAGMTFALVGLLYYSRWSAVYWFISFIFYESFAFLPFLLPALDEEVRKKMKRFLLIYGSAVAVYLLLRWISSAYVGAVGLRYPLDMGHYGFNIIKKATHYVLFHISIQSSLKRYELLTWLLRAVIIVACWQHRHWLTENKKPVGLLLAVYFLTLSPVVLVSHPAPRGSFSATLVFCILLAVLMARSHPGFTAAITALFITGHILGAEKIDFNSRLYAARVDKIKEAVDQLPEGRLTCIQVDGFEQGYKKEWFLQAGFSLTGLTAELKAVSPRKDFILSRDCGKRSARQIVTFP